MTTKEKNKLNEIKKRVEVSSSQIDGMVDKIISPYCKHLDDYIEFIAECLQDGNKQATDAELDDWCLNLSTYIYFASSMCENLGIRDDVARAVYKEIYHSKRARIDGGTIADKNSLAELASQEEYIISTVYARAYKAMKAKVEGGQELLGSVKKVLSHRMQDMELTKIGGSK